MSESFAELFEESLKINYCKKSRNIPFCGKFYTDSYKLISVTTVMGDSVKLGDSVKSREEWLLEELLK